MTTRAEMRPQVEHDAGTDVGGDAVRDLFAAVSALAPAERRRYLDLNCTNSPALRCEVESLLGFHDTQGEFLEQGAAKDAGIAVVTETPAEGLAPGARIGQYTIVRVIGAGGMGIVYEAEQESPRRRVALKVMRPGFISATMLRRFKHEAAALALLQHPGIAQIYEAGRDLSSGPGTPYLVIELVSGRPLSGFVQERALSTQDRLSLFLQVCEAVTHAHQRGVIHRDLKPANILVDESRRTKILDFGIARLGDSDLRATTATISGQVLGTLAYMGPEQASGDPAKIDVRADVYSLGAILYELLTGRLPIDLSKCSVAEALRRIGESEPAPLGTIDRTLRGDLAVIAARALEKDPIRRYQSVADLGEDIRRFLANEPIRAKQDSSLYVLGKQIRKYQSAVTVGAMFIVGILAFAVYATVQSRHNAELARSESIAREKADTARVAAEVARTRADESRKRADDAATSLARELSVSNVGRARWLLETGSFGAAEEMIWREHLQNPESIYSHMALWDLYARYPTLLNLHTGDPHGRAIDLHPNGHVVVTSGAGGRVGLWDLDTAQLLAEECAADAEVISVAFSPDGSRVLTLGMEGRAIMWDASRPRTLERMYEVRAYRADARACAYSPDGRTFATAGRGGVRVFDAATGSRRLALSPTGRTRNTMWNTVAYTRDNASLAFAGDRSLFLADLTAPNPARALTEFNVGTSNIGAVTFTADGKRLFVGAGGTDTAIYVYDCATRQRISRTWTANGTVRGLSLSSDERLLVTAGWWRSESWVVGDESISATGSATGSMLTPAATQPERPLGGYRALFLPGDRRIVAPDTSGGCRVWDLQASAHVATIKAHDRYIGKANTSADGSLLLTISAGGMAALWDTRTWRQIRVFADADFHCWVGTISDDGSRIALGSRDWRVRVENINTCEAPIEFDDLGGVTSDMVFAPDGKTLIAAALNGRTRIWTLDGTRRAGALDCDRSEIARLRLAPDGRTVILSQRNGRATGCDVETGAAVFTIPTTERRVRSADFSPDASSIVYGTWSGAVAIANIARARTMLTIDAHTEVVRDIRWSPDGRYIATVAGEGSVKLWDATNGLYLLSLGEGRSTSQSPSETSGPTNFIFIPNSKRVVITYDDGRIEVWDLGAFDHHIAGNVEQFLAKLGPELGDKVDAERVRTWARTLTKN